MSANGTSLADVVVEGTRVLKRRLAEGDILPKSFGYSGTVSGFADGVAQVLVDEPNAGVLPARSNVGWLPVGARVHVRHEDGVNYVTAQAGAAEWATEWVPTLYSDGATALLAASEGFWLRQGQTLDVQAKVTLGGTPPGGSLLQVDLPAGMTTIAVDSMVCGHGYAIWADAANGGGLASREGFEVLYTADGLHLKFFRADHSTPGFTVYGPSTPWPWGANDVLSWSARIICASGS